MPKISLSRYVYLILLLIIAAHLFVLSKINFFPYPELFVYPYLVEHGLLPYKQLFDQHLPSILMFPINIRDLGLSTPFEALLWLKGLVLATHLGIFLTGRKIFKSTGLALIGNVVYLIVQPLFEGYILWLDTFLAAIIVFGFFFYLKSLESKKFRDVIFAGVLLGLAPFIKQVMTPLVIASGIFYFYKTKNLRNSAIFLSTAFTPLIITIIWAINKHIFSEFFFWTLTFNFEIYAKMGQKFATFGQLARVGVVFIPALYWFFKNLKNDKTTALGIFMVFSSFAAASRFEFVHLQPALPFVAILVVGLLAKAEKFRRLLLSVLGVTIFFWALLFYQTHRDRKIYFFDESNLATAKFAKAYTQEDESIFVYGAQSVIYPLADRLPPGRVFTISVPWNMQVSEHLILQGLIDEPPKLVVWDRGAQIDGQKVTDFTSKINEHILDNYSKITQIGSNEIYAHRD